MSSAPQPSKTAAIAASYPAPKAATWVARDFRFHTGETLPELKLHYHTVGDPAGEPVLIVGNHPSVNDWPSHAALTLADRVHQLLSRERAQIFQRCGSCGFGELVARCFGVGKNARGADGVGVELRELAIASGARLLVAKHLADLIPPKWLWQRVEVFRNEARQWRRQIVAHREPLLVVIAERKNAFIRPVLVGQEFAESVGVLERRRLESIEAIGVVDGANGVEHAPLGC